MKRILIALLTLLVAAGVAWLVTRDQEQSARAERAQIRLLDFDARAVEAFTWSVDGDAWRFERDGDRWRVVSPVVDRADPGSVQRLFALALNADALQVIEDPADLADYGLDPPRRRLEVEGVDSPALRVGDKTPTSDGFFAHVEGRDEVLVLDYVTGRTLQVHPELMREATLTGARRGEITAIDIGWSDSTARLEREGESWWFVDPVRLPASASAVDRLLAALDETLVQGFIDDADPADPRFALEADSTLHLALQLDGTRRVLAFGATSEDGMRYTRLEGRDTVLLVPQEGLDGLPAGMQDLTARGLTAVNRYRVQRFDYRNGPASVSAARGDDGSWFSDDGRRLDDGQVYRLLVAVLEARVASWSVEPGTPGGTPVASLSFEVEDSAADRIVFYPGRRARVDSLPDVLFVTAGDPPPVPAALRGS